MSNNNNRNRKQRKPKFERIQKEAEFTEVVGETKEAQGSNEVIDLNDVAFGVFVGRKKTGEPFVLNVGTMDVFLVDGLLDYGKRHLDNVFRQHFEDQDRKDGDNQ